MTILIGLDIGTTHLGACALEGSSPARLLASVQMPNSAARYADGRAELDINELYHLSLLLLSMLAESLGSRCSQVAAIGVTGQQHGLVLLDAMNRPVMPAITWQDRRVLEPTTEGRTWLDDFIAAAGGADAFEPMGCSPAAGYLGPSLYWLRRNGYLPRDITACLVPDAVCAYLTGTRPVTDPTNAGSTALFDLRRFRWAEELCKRLELPPEILAPVLPSGSLAGCLSPQAAAATGFSSGIPVAVAMGDNQASFLGSVPKPRQSVLLNVGTGAQCSVMMDVFMRLPELDTRAFPGNRLLLVGAGLFGGRSYAYLQRLFQQVGAELLGTQPPDELFERMNRLAAAVPPGCDGLRCLPLFSGTRADPTVRASFYGISVDNFTPGHLTRALLEGMAELFYRFYEQMLPVSGRRQLVVGAGNGIRRNPVLASILAARFGSPLSLPAWEEEATAGAALGAAVTVGIAANWDAASQMVPTLEPNL